MRKPNLEDVVAHGSDYPVPQVAVPDHHDRRRPLTVCLWDAPNMDASLFSVTGADHHTIVRPQYDAFSRWLVNQRPPSPSKSEPGSPYDVEALLFLSVVSARSTQVAPFVTAARQSGFTVFCRDRDEGDIDDAIVAVAGQRLAERDQPRLITGKLRHPFVYGKGFVGGDDIIAFLAKRLDHERNHFVGAIADNK